MHYTTASLAASSLLAVVALITGCAGSTLNRMPDSSYERDSRSTIEQKAADTLRRAGASTEAKEAQNRADKSLEEERKNPGTSFFADLLYSIFGIAREIKSEDRSPSR